MKLTRCPKCQGTTGHKHVQATRHTMIGAWGCKAENACPDPPQHSPGFVRCIDCNALVPMPAAQGQDCKP